MQRYIYILLIAITVSCFSCKTDFDINAEYKDITVVYCLLSHNDTVHYVRINKAFLGEGNALIFASDPANSLYPYEEIEASMEVWENNTMIASYMLDTVTLSNKEPGIFYAPHHVLYSFSATLIPTATYKLVIRNRKLGKLIEAETEIVRNFQFEKPYMPPIPPPPQVYIHPFISFVGTSPISLEWQSAKNGKRYQVMLRYYYKEMNVVNPDTVVKSIDWNLGTLKSPDINGNKPMKIDINKEGFFVMLKNNIPVNTNVKRLSMYMDFIFSVAGEEFNTYMEVNEPSTNLIQEKPEYTNISNGLGIFCSRYVKDKHNDGRPMRFQLNPQSISLLINGEHTNNLGFIVFEP